MGYKNREIEWKLVVEGTPSMTAVDRIVRKVVKDNWQECREMIIGCAADTYWESPEESVADFARLRILDEEDENGCIGQITLKCSDKGSNVNRVELDMPIHDPSQANKFLTIMLGDPLGQVTKRYTVYFLENVHTTISVYKVMKDKRIFVEVEATTLKRVKEIAKVLMEQGNLKFMRSSRSLYDIFVQKRPLELEPVQI